MNKRINQKGFTLLEVIIVVIIVGVLMSLALPRFFSVVEQSRGAEALQNISALRGAIVRCGLKVGNYAGGGCNNFTSSTNLDVLDPSTAGNSHFTYGINVGSGGIFTITATRNTRAGGDNSSTVFLNQNDDAPSVTKGGTGKFLGI